jgi:hypothetical protein
MARAAPDEEAAVLAEYQARCAEIEAEARERLEMWENLSPLERQRLPQYSPENTAKWERKALEEEEGAFLRKIDVLKTRRRIAEAGLNAGPDGGASRRVARDPRRTKSGRGRGLGAVSEAEANEAARMYMANRKVYRRATDGGAYAVHALYKDEAGDPALSRPMVGHLIAALESGKLGWDAEKRALKIPGEFWTSRTMFVIPR